LQCVAVCCSVLQCVAVCCSVLQCVAVCCSVLQCVAVCCSVCCNVIQFNSHVSFVVTVCCSELQSVLQCSLAQFARELLSPPVCVLQHVATCCSV